MSEAKFTKGEWVSGILSIKDAEDYSIDCDVDCGWGYVGTESKCIALAVTKSHDDTELDANISLIAAAPEMYEMLHKMQAVVYHLSNEIELRDSKREACRDDFSSINELLAKARGES